MNLLEAYATLATNGIALLRAAHDTTSLHSLLPAHRADELATLAEIYFGPTTHRRYQRTAIHAAERTGHGLAELRRIETYTHKLTTPTDRWALRTHLCTTPAAHIHSEAATMLRTLRTRPSAPTPGIRIRRRTGTRPDTFSYTGPSDLVTQLFDRLDGPDHDTAIRRLLHTDTPASAGGATDDSRPEAAPHIIIHIDDLVAAEQGNTDITLTLTNGARITGAEYAAKRLYDVGFVTLVSPVDGPVNLYRTSRFANEKQRLMASAEHPVCSWPRCRQPAQRCQIHHLTAWKHGGQTNPDNLTVLCRYHNGVNDDEPGVSRRGRLVRQDGTVVWVPPGDNSPRHDTQPPPTE